MAVLFFITMMVVGAFGFVPVPARSQLKLSGGPYQVLERPNADHSEGLPVKYTVKTGRRTTYLAPPVPIRQQRNEDEPTLIRSVLVPQVFSYRVVQQPEDEPYYVSSARELVTEFGLAQRYNNVGLLAHNNLAGRKFKDLTLGQKIYVIHENGHTDRYTVSAIYRFKALDSTKTESQFVDLDSSQTYSASEVFNRMYAGEPHLTFQTCIEAEGDASWGRLFVLATPDTIYK